MPSPADGAARAVSARARALPGDRRQLLEQWLATAAHAVGRAPGAPAPVASAPESGSLFRPRRQVDGPPLVRLPNGLEVAFQSVTEVEHFYHDIFEAGCYLRHGIRLEPAAHGVDAGANVGMFTLFAGVSCAAARILSIEPAPPLVRLLGWNVRAHRVPATIVNCGVGREATEASFTFYPHSSGMSSFQANVAEEADVLRQMLRNGAGGSDVATATWRDTPDELLAARFVAETFTCQLRPLSALIAEHGLDHIDLLKIDVQKSEADVLAGIDAEHWPRIEQIVLEVHDIDDRLRQVTELLAERGFHVAVEQDELLRGSVLFVVFATRRRRAC